jgi:mitochondrial chaperone BCS1
MAALFLRTALSPFARARHLCTTTVTALQDNQFATGGLAVLAGGAGLAALRYLANLACDAILRRLMLHAEFDSRDDSYRWLTSWLASHPHFQTTRRFSVVTTLRRLGYSSVDDDNVQGCEQGGVILLPLGTSIIRHKNRWLLVERERHTDARPTDTGKERETLTFRVPGGTKRDLIELVAEAHEAFEARQRGWTRCAQESPTLGH